MEEDGTLTFSNPNYYRASDAVESKPRPWRWFRYERNEERVSMLPSAPTEEKLNNQEAASLLAKKENRDVDSCERENVNNSAEVPRIASAESLSTPEGGQKLEDKNIYKPELSPGKSKNVNEKVKLDIETNI